MEATYMSTDREMDQEDMVYIDNEILLIHKNNEVISFSATWIDLEIIILSEIKSERERQVSDGITYMWNLKKNNKDTIKLIYKIETDSQTSKPNLEL